VDNRQPELDMRFQPNLGSDADAVRLISMHRVRTQVPRMYAATADRLPDPGSMEYFQRGDSGSRAMMKTLGRDEPRAHHCDDIPDSTQEWASVQMNHQI